LPKSINQTGQQQCSPEAAHRFMQNSNNILMDLGTDSVLLFKAAHRRGLSINMIAIKIKIIKKKRQKEDHLKQQNHSPKLRQPNPLQSENKLHQKPEK
jgi:hypothetical protein